MYGIAFSPDGRRLVTAGVDSCIRVWDLATGAELHRLKEDGNDNIIWHVSFSPDGAILASSAGNGSTCLWDTKTCKPIRRLGKQGDDTSHFQFSPDGKMLATGENNLGFSLWDVSTGKELCQVSGHQDVLNSGVFSPNGKTFITASLDGTVLIWDVEAILQLPPSHGKQLANHLARPLPPGTLARLGPVRGQDEGGSISMAVTSAGNILASASTRTIRTWNCGTGKELRVTTSHPHEITAVALAADGRTLALADSEGTVCLWDSASGKQRQRIEEAPIPHDIARFFGGGRTLTFSPDGAVLVSGRADGLIYLWDAATGKLIRKIALPGHSLSRLACSPDAKLLAAAFVNLSDPSVAFVHLWSLKSGYVFPPIKLSQPKRDVNPWANLPNAEDLAVSFVAFSLDSKMLATSETTAGIGRNHSSHAIRLWEVATGTEILRLEPGDRTTALAFSSNDKVLLTYTGHRWSGHPEIQGVCRCWDLAEGRVMARLELTGHEKEIQQVLFSPDGKKLATAGEEGTVLIRDTTRPRPNKRSRPSALVLPPMEDAWAAWPAPTGPGRMTPSGV